MSEDNNYEVASALKYIKSALESLKACDDAVGTSGPPKAFKLVIEYLPIASNALGDMQKEIEQPASPEEALVQRALARDIFIDLGCCSRFAHQLNETFQDHLSRTTQDESLRNCAVLPRSDMRTLLGQMIGVLKYVLYAWELIARGTGKLEAQMHCKRLSDALRYLDLGEVNTLTGQVDISTKQTHGPLKEVDTAQEEIDVLPEEFDTCPEKLDISIEEVDVSISEAGSLMKQEIDNLGEERGILEQFVNNSSVQQFHVTNKGFMTNHDTITEIKLVKVKNDALQAPVVVGDGIHPQEEKTYYGGADCTNRWFNREMIPSFQVCMHLPYHIWRHRYRAIIFGAPVVVVFIMRVVQRLEGLLH